MNDKPRQRGAAREYFLIATMLVFIVATAVRFRFLFVPIDQTEDCECP
jgi:hypothetical protein